MLFPDLGSNSELNILAPTIGRLILSTQHEDRNCSKVTRSEMCMSAAKKSAEKYATDFSSNSNIFLGMVCSWRIVATKSQSSPITALKPALKAHIAIGGCN